WPPMQRWLALPEAVLVMGGRVVLQVLSIEMLGDVRPQLGQNDPEASACEQPGDCAAPAAASHDREIRLLHHAPPRLTRRRSQSSPPALETRARIFLRRGG